jgi:hypothetical protein
MITMAGSALSSADVRASRQMRALVRLGFRDGADGESVGERGLLSGYHGVRGGHARVTATGMGIAMGHAGRSLYHGCR